MTDGADDENDDRTLVERVDIRGWFSVSREVLTETYSEWRGDRTLRLGAGLAYYALFTVVPFLALTAALAGQVFGLDDFESYLIDRVAQFGVQDAQATGEAIATELDRRSVNSTLGIIGLGTLIFSSSLVFLALVDAVNAIWHVPVRSGFRNSIRRRLVSFSMVLITGVVIIGGFALSAISGVADFLLPVSLPLIDTLANVLASLASGVALAVVLTLLFHFVGPVRPPLLASMLSAILTSALLLLGTIAIGVYLRSFGGASLTGAFGAVLLALTWVYYEAQIVLGGVQLVKVVTWRTADPEDAEHPPNG